MILSQYRLKVSALFPGQSCLTAFHPLMSEQRAHVSPATDSGCSSGAVRPARLLISLENPSLAAMATFFLSAKVSFFYSSPLFSLLFLPSLSLTSLLLFQSLFGKSSLSEIVVFSCSVACEASLSTSSVPCPSVYLIYLPLVLLLCLLTSASLSWPLSCSRCCFPFTFSTLVFASTSRELDKDEVTEVWTTTNIALQNLLPLLGW